MHGMQVSDVDSVGESGHRKVEKVEVDEVTLVSANMRRGVDDAASVGGSKVRHQRCGDVGRGDIGRGVRGSDDRSCAQAIEA